MRLIDAALKAKILQAYQTIYGNNEPEMEVLATRPTTPIRTKNYWEETIVTEGVTSVSTSVAIRCTTTGLGSVAYVAYVDDSGVLTVKSATIVMPITNMVWSVVETIPGCAACSLDFDGSFIHGQRDIVEYLTDELPWLFYVTSTGQLMAGVLGGSYESLVGANVTAIDAVRGVASKYKDIDQGLLVFYVVAGDLYYRDLIAGVWGDQTSVSIAPADIVSVRAERTFDYRIVLQVTDTSGALYEIFTKMESSGWNGPEFIQVSNITIKSAYMTQIDYLEYRNDNERITVSNIWADPWLMNEVVPATIMDAENLPIEYAYNYTGEDWGYLVRIEFTQILRNAEDYPAQFKLEDDNGTIWYGQEAYKEDRHSRVVYVLFTNFNNAVNPVTITALGGTLSNGVLALSETSLEFTAENLVPFATDPPVPLRIWNNENKIIYIEFDKPIDSIASQEGFVVSGIEPDMSPEGELVATNYVIDDIEIPVSVQINKLLLGEGTHSGTADADGVLSFDIDPVEVVSSVTDNRGTNSTSTVVTLASGAEASDLHVVIISKDGTGTFDTPAGWILLGQRAYSAMCLAIFYKVSDGEETEVTITHASETAAWIAMVLRNTATPVLSAYAEGASANPDSPELESAFDLGTLTKWFSIAGWDYGRTVSAYPANMTDDRTSSVVIGSAGCGVAMASLTDREVSADPSAFTINSSDQWVAYTMALKSSSVIASPATWTSKGLSVSIFDNNSKLSWDETAPAGSSVLVEYGFSVDAETLPSSWTTIASLDALDLSGTSETDYLFIRVTLTSTGPIPTVSNLRVIDENEKGRIQINLTAVGRMKHPQGYVTVNFTGSMFGAGASAVEPFSEQFIPENLVLWFKPHDPEYIEVANITMDAALTRIYYEENQSGDEFVEVSNIRITKTDLIHVDDIET